MSNLFETPFHTLAKDEVVDQRGEKSVGYVVTNTKTNVVEFEGFNFVECVQFMKYMEPQLQEFYSEDDEATQIAFPH